MATDFISFLEGEDSILASGMPATCHLLLSTNSCSGSSPFSTSDTLAGGVGEITGTGYARTSQALPTPTAGTIAFAISTWNTASATDWPSTVRSVVLATTADNSGKAICAWNLVPGNGARDLSHAATVESATPTLTTESIDVSFASTVASLGVTTAATFSTVSTQYVAPTDTVLVDVGSNCVATGGGDFIYLVPSTGVYQIEIQCSIFATITGAGTANLIFGPAVGSTITGSTDISNATETTLNFGAAGFEGFSPVWAGYLNCTAGQYINTSLMWNASSLVTHLQEDSGVGGLMISTQRIA